MARTQIQRAAHGADSQVVREFTTVLYMQVSKSLRNEQLDGLIQHFFALIAKQLLRLCIQPFNAAIGVDQQEDFSDPARYKIVLSVFLPSTCIQRDLNRSLRICC
jgi:hypothetical protein